MKTVSLLLVSAVFLSLTAGGESTVEFPVRRLRLGTVTLKVEVADTDGRRARGLMFRHALPEEQGMFFLFNEERELSFWMKNTFVPLSIGFFNHKKELLEIIDMTPVKSEMDRTVPSYQSRAPAQYALEVNVGWFKRHKVAVGTKWQWDDDLPKSGKTD